MGRWIIDGKSRYKVNEERCGTERVGMFFRWKTSLKG